jgi:integrase
MASIQRIVSPITGEVSYRAQVRVKGHEPQGKTFPNKKEAAAWAGSIESAIREARYFPNQRASRTPFAEIVARYRETAFSNLKASGIDTRKQHLDWWVERFAGKTLAEITPDLVAEARDALASTTYSRGKPQKDDNGNVVPPKQYSRSGATTNRYLATLSHLFTVASKEWRLTDRNPVRDIAKKRESRGRVRFLTDEERKRLIEACTNSQWKSLAALVLLAISTGARRGELISLRWSDVDLKANRATVHDTKNGDPRVLPLVGKALEALRDLKLQGSAKSEYVFPQPSGFPGPYEHFDQHWYVALAAAGVADLRFHDLRHTTASYLAQQGASLLEIADTLGHRTMAMVKRYAHLAQSHKVSVIEKMAKDRDL